MSSAKYWGRVLKESGGEVGPETDECVKSVDGVDSAVDEVVRRRRG